MDLGIDRVCINHAKSGDRRTALTAAVLLCSFFSIFSAPPFFRDVVVFSSGTNGYNTFRIPAILSAGNGDLLAFCEGRVSSSGDYGNIDIVMRRSTDSGKTWGALQVVAQNGSYQAGNPGPVLDTMDPAHRGRIWLVYNISKNGESEIWAGTGVREIMVIRSDDHGATWSTPANITASVHRPNETAGGYSYTFAEDWRWYAITPGHALQLTIGPLAGRLLIPCNHSLANSEVHSHCFYSDDHGTAWKLGGTVSDPHTNECQAVQLINGDVMINMRNHQSAATYRAVAASSDGGLTWGPVRRDTALPEPRCAASIIRFTTAASGGRNRILFSNPASTAGRDNNTVKMSYDEGQTWPVNRTVCATSASYSDLAIQCDRRIGVLYETGAYSGTVIHYATFNLEWLSQGRDSLGSGQTAVFRSFSGKAANETGSTVTGAVAAYNLAGKKVAVFAGGKIPGEFFAAGNTGVCIVTIRGNPGKRCLRLFKCR